MQLQLGSFSDEMVQPPASGRPGAAGEIELDRDQKHELRKSASTAEDATILQGVDLDENSNVSVAAQVRRPARRTVPPPARAVA